MLAMNDKGQLTECRAKVMGQGRCNHTMHQKPGQSTEEFIKEVNAQNDNNSITRVREKLKTPMDIKDKKALSGNFSRCVFVKNEQIESLAEKIKSANETFHNDAERESRNTNVDAYEENFPGKVQDMFVVDRRHKDGDELHVVKNNGIIEIYNIRKFKEGENSLITKLIARPAQISRYYKWNNCYTPKYLKDIARHNENLNRNNW